MVFRDFVISSDEKLSKKIRVIKIDPTDLAIVNFFLKFYTGHFFESYNYGFLMFELIVLELRDTLNDCFTLNDNGVNGFQFQIESFLSGIDELSVSRNLQFVKNLILALVQPRTRYFIPVQHFKTERLSTKCYQIHLNFKRTRCDTITKPIFNAILYFLSLF